MQVFKTHIIISLPFPTHDSSQFYILLIYCNPVGIHDRNLVVGGYSVSSKGFAELVRRLMSLSPGGRVVAALEGGYECRGVAESVAAVIEAMLDYEDYHDKKDASADSPLSKSDGMSASIHPHTLSTILDAKSKLATTWKCFQTK